jgi:hypothetical protein
MPLAPLRRVALATALLMPSLPGAAQVTAPAPRTPPAVRPPAVSIPAQLMITDLRVIEDPVRTNRNDPNAPWTFRHVAQGLAGTGDPSALVLEWLEEWESSFAAAGGTASPRPAIRPLVIEPWLAASGGSRLDMSKAPFKLLAIVNRIDLRDNDAGTVASAGEGRFVFGVTRQDGKPLAPAIGPGAGGFFVIVEYELPATSIAELRSWAQAWAALGDAPVGSALHRIALEGVTRRFTDTRFAGRPNGSALAQIRTNEISLAPSWELREFRLDTGGFLRSSSVVGTPDTIRLNGTPAFAQLVNENEASLLDATFSLSPSLESGGSLAGNFLQMDFPDFARRTFVRRPVGPPPPPGGPPPPLEIPWSAAGIRSNDARHALAVSTCNGCHRSETATPFVHVAFPPQSANTLPATLGGPALLSRFLLGEVIADPVVGTTQRSFNDLERRRLDFEALLASLAGRTTLLTPHPRPLLAH